MPWCSTCFSHADEKEAMAKTTKASEFKKLVRWNIMISNLSRLWLKSDIDVLKRDWMIVNGRSNLNFREESTAPFILHHFSEFWPCQAMEYSRRVEIWMKVWPQVLPNVKKCQNAENHTEETTHRMWMRRGKELLLQLSSVMSLVWFHEQDQILSSSQHVGSNPQLS